MDKTPPTAEQQRLLVEASCRVANDIKKAKGEPERWNAPGLLALVGKHDHQWDELECELVDSRWDKKFGLLAVAADALHNVPRFAAKGFRGFSMEYFRLCSGIACDVGALERI